MDKSWIHLPNILSKEYTDGILAFIEVAKKYLNSEGNSRCPCRKCLNSYWRPIDAIHKHIYMYGFSRLYENWVFHGEEYGATTSRVGPQETEDVGEADDDIMDILNDVHQSIQNTDMENIDEDAFADENKNDEHESFEYLSAEAEKKLYPECKVSTLTFVVKLMHIKVINHWSNKSLDMLL